MSRTCTICGHGQRHDIEVALVRRDSYRTIARRFSVSKDALGRHAREHLPKVLTTAQEAKEVVRADDLLTQVRDLQSRTLAILEASHDSGEHRTALAAIGQARANLELQARLLQLIKEGPTINVLVSPEWVELRAVIISALEPYEAARSAVVGALEGQGDGLRFSNDLVLGLDRIRFAEELGISPDPWQRDLLRSASKRVLLNITRQGGKSTTAAVIALHRALYYSRDSRSQPRAHAQHGEDR